MPSALKIWGLVHKKFDPLIPADLTTRVPRAKYNPLAEKIAPRLRLPLDFQKYVLAGGIGSGKSTELRATIEGLGHSKLVVFIDLWEHFRASDPGAFNHLQPAELLGLLGLAVLRTGTDLLGHPWGVQETNFKNAIAGLNKSPADGDEPEIDVVTLAKGLSIFVGGAIVGPGAVAAGGVVGGGLQLLKSVAEATSWTWKVGERGRQRSSDQDPPVQAMLKATNGLLDAIRTKYERGVVLLVDGLDRVDDKEAFQELFVESGLLRGLRCDIVATLDLGLVQKNRSHLQWCDKAYDFTYVPVACQQDAGRHPEGMAFFRDLAKQRFNLIEGGSDLISPSQIDELAYRSGGRLRDFIALVREVAVLAMLESAPKATDTHIAQAIDELRRDRENGLDKAHIDTLQRVLLDPRRQLPAGDVALDLIHRQLLLAYPNDSTWYLPHTILMLKLLAPTGANDSV